MAFMVAGDGSEAIGSAVGKAATWTADKAKRMAAEVTLRTDEMVNFMFGLLREAKNESVEEVRVSVGEERL